MTAGISSIFFELTNKNCAIAAGSISRRLGSPFMFPVRCNSSKVETMGVREIIGCLYIV